MKRIYLIPIVLVVVLLLNGLSFYGLNPQKVVVLPVGYTLEIMDRNASSDGRLIVTAVSGQ